MGSAFRYTRREVRLSRSFFSTASCSRSFPRAALAEDSGPEQAGGGQRDSYHFTIAHNVASRAEVDAVLAEAEAAGATIIKPAADTFWGGYSGYFADPDGFQWEIATGSGLPVDPSAR